MAVNVANTYPYFISSPSLQSIFVIVPGIGATISFCIYSSYCTND